MEITAEQYARIEDVLPVQRGNVRLSNLDVLNAILYVAEHGCKWRGLPKRFGRWHTVYTRMNRWSKNGVLDAVFEKLQREQLIRIQIQSVSMDSTIVKVHPDGTGALKKRPTSDRKIARRMEHQDSSGCRECSNGHNVRAVAGPSARRAARTRSVGGLRPVARADAAVNGRRLCRRTDSSTGVGLRMDSRGSAAAQQRSAVGLRSRALSSTQSGRTTVSATERLSSHLLSFRQARRRLSRLPDLRPHR